MNSIRNFFAQRPNNPFEMLQRFNQFRSDPIGALMRSNPNLNIPQNISNNPQAIVQYLLSTGQMSQEQFQQFSQQANQLQGMLPRY
jgi:hypothetical protein